jgi:penicillin amidase
MTSFSPDSRHFSWPSPQFFQAHLRACFLLLSLFGLAGLNFACDEASLASLPRPAHAGFLRTATGNVTASGPQKDVEILIDEQGMPHIFAQNDQDLFWASGYQMACDELFSIDMNRRRATGRMAEVIGTEGVESDITIRTLGLLPLAEQSLGLLEKARPGDFALLQAFVAGINQRVSEILADPTQLPLEYGLDHYNLAPQEFSLADIMAIGQMILFGHSSTFEIDILNTVLQLAVRDYADLPLFVPGERFYTMTSLSAISGGTPPQNLVMNPASSGGGGVGNPSARPVESPRISPREWQDLLDAIGRYRKNLRIGEGSNNWALRGEYTSSGYPMLANDSHAYYAEPNIMYLQHLNSADAGGNFDVAGFSFVGVPAVQIGANRAISWGGTTNFADATDLWRVRVRADTALIGTKWVPIQIRRESFQVRQPDGSLRPQELVIRSVTGYGVFLPPEIFALPTFLTQNHALLLNWPGFQVGVELPMYFDLDRAKNLADFSQAIDWQRVGMHNWVAASRSGIRYKTHGLIPDRGPLAGRPAANTIMDATQSGTFWTGQYLASDKLPALDGSQPFITTANNDPWGHTDDNLPLNDPFYYGSWFDPGFRVKFIADSLNRFIAAGKVNLSQMEQLQMESHSPLAARLIPLLKQAGAALKTQPQLLPYRNRSDIPKAIDALVRWNQVMARSSAEAALYRIWLAYLAKNTLKDELTVFFEPIDAVQPIVMAKAAMLIHERQIATILDFNSQFLLIKSLADALAEVATRQAKKSGTYLWSDLMAIIFDDSAGIAQRSMSKDGDDSSVNVSQLACWENGAIAEKCQATDGAVYRFITNFGPGDQVEMWFNFPLGNAGDTTDWLEGRYKRVPFDRPDIEAQLRTSRVIPAAL